ncbi:NRAMP family divalent metal transporter [Entomohabitans teleogrylli]|uniref:NRAMP family divalent metal transporter n=1 Tax=Entomohabitans teleogrylli TaxID=1384589 RepID=UPI00073D552A|nr:divalent metal cation transporter [Entomohabitans teleogrylli]
MSEISSPQWDNLTPGQRWKQRMQALGPGILVATAAVGGSHLVASTQAGALYGWQLVLLIILANLFKYPFFRFATHYTLSTGLSLIEGYQKKGRFWLLGFTALNLVAGVVNMAGVLILTAALLQYFIPIELSLTVLCLLLLAISLVIVLVGHYKALDRAGKLIMFMLTVTTVIAACIAWYNGPVAPEGFQSPSPWTLSALAFLVPMVGWMPAPIEISAINSMWLISRQRLTPVSLRNALFDCNVGYWLTALLALVFLSLGALVQHGSPVQLEMAGGAFASQLISMYAATIGEWARLLVALIAFLCMFGTTLTVLDGYARTINESMRLLRGSEVRTQRSLSLWVLFLAASGMLIILQFKSALSPMLTFAMVMSFLTTPLFAWLNFSLVRDTKQCPFPQPFWLVALAWLGLFFLTGFALLFLWWRYLM